MNSVELPDLDRLEALVREYGNTPTLGDGRTRKVVMSEIYSMFTHQYQQRGEAPQAELVQWSNIQHVVQQIAKFCFGHPDEKTVITLGWAYAAVVNCLSAKDRLNIKMQPLPTPATQHAESGAPADSDEISDLLETLLRPYGVFDVAIVNAHAETQRDFFALKDRARAALAAQSQGAQKVPEPSRASRIECALRQIVEADDGSALTQALIESGRAALAAKAEAPK